MSLWHPKRQQVEGATRVAVAFGTVVLLLHCLYYYSPEGSTPRTTEFEESMLVSSCRDSMA